MSTPWTPPPTASASSPGTDRPEGLGVHRSPVVEAHGTLQSRGAKLRRDLDRAAKRGGVDVAGIRRDGRPQLSPYWFYWDSQRFYVSTTRSRVKYAIFRRDPRAQLLVDDPTGFRAVLVPATTEIRKDIAAELPRFRAIRGKHGLAVPDDEEHLRALAAERRVLLAFTPDRPPSSWTTWGLD